MKRDCARRSPAVSLFLMERSPLPGLSEALAEGVQDVGEQLVALLCQGEFLSVSAIAHTCGFPDEKYFMRLFKKQEGMTPGQYRQAFRQKSINAR